MKRLMLTVAMAVPLLAVGAAQGQQPRHNSVAAPPASAAPAIGSHLDSSYDMRPYQTDSNRYEDPRTTIRRRAEQRATQREDRLAMLKWYGISNLRPAVSPMPWYGMYGPTWSSNNPDPMRWTPSNPFYVVHPHYGLWY